ncbi:unnamed protein product [Cercopithifilaria johnstoni]|uniref:Uncharacterized protein n=1 Tax=Cercopithifilaria johnstoni TaxID=2874296 RepID=A0A8J2LVE0_9BILA|nr:unnamed protein product [Cercopithifilaria johnstoni]
MHTTAENNLMELLSIKPTVSRPSLSSLWSLHVHLQSEAHDIDLRSVSHTSLPTTLLPNLNNTTLLRNVKSLSDLRETYQLDFSLPNIRDEKSYITQPTVQDQITAKQRNRCVFEWLEGVEKKAYYLPTI